MISRRSSSSSDPLGLGRPLRVLVVDDELDTLAMFEVLFGSLGWEVASAPSGEQALDRFDPERIDAVISDISLPAMNGYEMIAALRERSDHRVYAIALTWFSEPKDVEQALEAGFDALLTKPVMVHVLLDTLRGLAARSR